MTGRREDLPAGDPAAARRNAAGVAVVVLAATLISLSLVLSRSVYEAGGNPATVITARMLVFVAAIWLLYRATGRSLRLAPAERKQSLALGVINLLGTGGYVWSILYLPVSLAVLAFYTYPLLTLIIASLLDRRLPRLLEVGALLAAFAGLGIALEVSFEGLHPAGLALVAMGAIGVAASFALSARIIGRADTARVTFHMAISSFVVATACTLATGSLQFPQTGVGGWLVFTAMLVTFVAGFFGMFQGVSMIGPVRTVLTMNLEPVATIGFAMLILGETLTGRQLGGAALVVGAVTLAQLAPRRTGN